MQSILVISVACVLAFVSLCSASPYVGVTTQKYNGSMNIGASFNGYGNDHLSYSSLYSLSFLSFLFLCVLFFLVFPLSFACGVTKVGLLCPSNPYPLTAGAAAACALEFDNAHVTHLSTCSYTSGAHSLIV